MRSITCARCGAQTPRRGTYSFRGADYCEACANELRADPAASDEEFAALQDPTLCAFCGSDAGEAEHPLQMGLPTCPSCEAHLYRAPLPRWVLGFLAGVAAILIFCRFKKVPVLEVKFFQFDMKTAGYVLHGPIEDFGAAFLISVGPFIVNSLLCMLICFPASIPLRIFGVSNFPSLVLLWLGVSIGMHAFPSTGDADNLMAQAKKAAAAKNKAAYVAYPVVWLIYLANLLSVIWFDALYGFFIGVILPSWVLKAL